MEVKKEISQEEIAKLINDETSRIELVKNSHMWFFNMYFNHYVYYEIAEFHKEMFRITEDESIKTAVIVSFRGSAKSAIFTTSYPIWAILGAPQKKFVVILGQTQRQARQHLSNIKKELENNERLKSDLGHFKEVEDEWGSYSLVIPKYNARITAVSMEQTIRGMRHEQYRPDLIIADDIEDLDTVKTKEGRDKIYKWTKGEIVPAGDRNTKMIFVGNLLHEDSLLMRLKDKIQNGKLKGCYYEVPLLDKDDNIAWPGKFPDMKAIEEEKNKISDEIAWAREYMLRIIPEEGCIVHREWIQYYDKIEEDEDDLKYILTGVDPAISMKDSADYTAIISAKVYDCDEKIKIYILPDIINEKMEFHKTVKKMKGIFKRLLSLILVESYGYQKALPDQLKSEGMNAEAINMGGNDKRSRLAISSYLIQSGQILFPRQGAEDLINQLVNFGIEKHDDLADALNVIAFKVITDNEEPTEAELIGFIDYSKPTGRMLSDNDSWDNDDD